MGLFDWLKPKPKPPPADRSWRVGDRVLAKWDAYFYPGHVQEASADAYHIVFDDGDAAWVNRALVLPPDIAVGSRVFGRVKGGPYYMPGVVRQQKGETIEIHYDHGEEEWTSISLVRVERGVPGMETLPPPPAPQKPQIDLGAPVRGSDWRIGDRIFARWVDLYWYPGTILGLGDKGVHVLFDDGDQRIVPEANIMPLTVEEGEHIFIRPKSQPQLIYTPAVVTRVEGESIDVALEEGEEETNTKVSRARFALPGGYGGLFLEEGQRVLATGLDECLYPAEIVSIEEDRIIVQYLAGAEGMLTPELIKKLDLRVGSKIECRWKGAPNYLPGTLAKIEGERIFVKYDDGDEEWTSVRLVRVAAPRAKA